MRNEKPLRTKRLDLPGADLMQRMLDLANGLHTTPPGERAMAALHGMADLSAADSVAAWNGGADRLVSVGIVARIGQAPSMAAMLPPGIRSLVAGDISSRPAVTLHTDAARRLHEIRSICADDAGPSLLVLRRTASAFTDRERAIVNLMHPQIEWCLRPPATPQVLASQLPAPQQVVFELLLNGSTEKQLAGKLKKSERVIQSHVKQICRHFDVSDRTQLMAKFEGSSNQK